MKAIKLRTEQKVNPIGIDGKEQFLSWICEDGISQSAYQIKACTGDQTIYDSGKVASQDMHHLLELNLESRQRVCWKVRLWDEKDEAGEWSEEAYFEMGLLQQRNTTAVMQSMHRQRGNGKHGKSKASMKYISLQATCDVYSVHLREQ